MDLEHFEKNPHNQSALLSLAKSLYEKKNNKDLEQLFARYLRKSYDVNFWNIYIDYVQNVSVKKVNISDVYAFVLNHFEHSYHKYPFIQAYIASLSSFDDNSLVVDKIRKIYQKAFETPFESIGKLWIEYEKWEISVNRGGSKHMIEQVQPLYLQSSSTYQKLSSDLQRNNYFKVLDLELRNPCRLPKASYTSRLGFIFNYFLDRQYDCEALWVLKSIYLPDAGDIARVPENKLLKIWYSFIYKKNLFDLDDAKNKEITVINYFSWVIKNEGMDVFRKRFREMKEEIGVHGYVFCGHVEYCQGNNKVLAYEIFQEGFSKYPNSSLLCEEYFGLFLSSGDDDNIRALFKKLRKTDRMWEEMIRYEFVNGNIERYKELLLERNDAVCNKEILKSVENLIERERKEGTEEVYENIIQNMKYYNLKIEIEEIISDFLKKLPIVTIEDNIFINLDNSLVIDLLKNVSLEENCNGC